MNAKIRIGGSFLISMSLQPLQIHCKMKEKGEYRMKIAIPMRKHDGRYIISNHYMEIAKKKNFTLIPIVPYGMDIEEVVRRCDGLLLPGGGDVNPAVYGEFDASIKYDEEIDTLDLQLIQAFQQAEKPMLGICRGMQMINVARHGTLLHDLDVLGYHHLHNKHQVYDHIIHITKDGVLSPMLQDGQKVNSFHHQAIAQLGEGLTVCATAPDGIIEAISGKHILGVQWHPERLLEAEVTWQLFDFFHKELAAFETKRLYLRAFLEEDVQDVFAYASNPEVGNHAGWKPHKNIEESKHIVKEIFMDQSQEVTYALVDKETSHVIGSIGYRPDSNANYAGCASVGYALSQAHWGKGLMLEALQGLLNHIFTTTHFDCVRICHDHDNPRSKRVIEKAGFVYEGTMHKSAMYLWNGEIKDRLFYFMSKEHYATLLERGMI